MSWHRKLTERAFFAVAFVLIATIGLAHYLGISGNDLLETVVNTVIATTVAWILTWFVFFAERRRAMRG